VELHHRVEVHAEEPQAPGSAAIRAPIISSKMPATSISSPFAGTPSSASGLRYTDRYLGIEVDDALELAEQTDV